MAFVRGAALVVLALALAGCALGGSEEKDEISAEQLAVMVLPRDELGAPEGFELDLEDSGRLTARDAADWTTDPNDSAADLRQDGWLSGYELTYSNPDRSVSFERGEGVITGDSTVQLFDTETSARAQLVQEIRDLERFRGKDLDGVRLARFETFDVDVGDEAWGVELTARARGVTLHGTGVFFRSGRLIADTGFLHVDEAGRHSEAVAAARALESRIQRSLAGELDAEPVPLPGQEPEVTQAQLSKMTLGLTDLPEGAFLTDEGRARGDGFVTFYRNFDVEQTMIGGSHLMFLRAQTQVFETKAAAQFMLRSISRPKGRSEFARGVLMGFSKLAGTKARNVRVAPLRGMQGDSTGVVVSFDLPSGRFRTATVVVRSGRSVAIVSGFCTAHAVHPNDLPPLGERARARLASIPV
jgi:hypothetical protein